MGAAKELVVRPVTPREANAIVRRYHYSGVTARATQVHFGVFWRGDLAGAMQFGAGIMHRRTQGLVRGTAWNGFLELGRLAFADILPRNSESRALAIALRLLKKHRPHLEWVLSYADATASGDGAIYRATGFLLTGINRNTEMFELPDGQRVCSIAVKNSGNRPRKELGGRSFFDVSGGSWSMKEWQRLSGARQAVGWQVRYIYLFDPKDRSRLTVPILPYSEIDKRGVRMYRGKRLGARSDTSDTPVSCQTGKGGAAPTLALPYHGDCLEVLVRRRLSAATAQGELFGKDEQ